LSVVDCSQYGSFRQAYPGGFSGVLDAADSAGKTHVLVLDADPRVNFTFWAAVFAMPFQNLAAYGTDQLNTQRMLCCRSVREARLALYASNAGEFVVLLFLLVGRVAVGLLPGQSARSCLRGARTAKHRSYFPRVHTVRDADWTARLYGGCVVRGGHVEPGVVRAR